MKYNYEHFKKIVNISDEDIKRLDDGLQVCFENSNYFLDFAIEASKLAQNEEEMKFIWFRLGQIEFFNFTISHFHLYLEKEEYMDAGFQRLGFEKKLEGR